MERRRSGPPASGDVPLSFSGTKVDVGGRVYDATKVACRAARFNGPMAGPATSQPTPQRLAAIREQLSLLADYL